MQNSSLYQSFQSAYAHKNHDDSNESYFDDAKHGLLKDLVDFQNRDDFDRYMRGIEKSYYQKVNISQPPYEKIPDYPPKPFQQNKKKRQEYEEQSKDFIEKVHQTNQKRTQIYQYPTPEQLHQQQTMQYYQTLSQKTINPNSIPFFETINNKENPNQSHSVFNQTSQQFPLSQRPPVTPPYMQKFVAGPTRLESNPLSEPSRTLKTSSPGKSIPQLTDYDLKNPDVQYERYKHLMNNQFYNNHANSLNSGFNMTSQHTVYHPPAPFQYAQPQPHPQNQQDMYAVSFNPNVRPPLPQHIYPQTQQMYHKIPDSISLYSQPGGPPPGFVDPMTYRMMKHNNTVDKHVIESIGGIQDTLKPLQETLKQHELRPFQIQHDYKKEYIYSSKGKDLKRSLSECKPDQMKLVSVSPYRAIVKIDQSYNNDHDNTYESQSDDEEEQQQHDVTKYVSANQSMRNSSIGPDSHILRGQKEQFLTSFNDRRVHNNSSVNESYENRGNSAKEHQKIKMESEFLRQQRESFLNSFSPNLGPLTGAR